MDDFKSTGLDDITKYGFIGGSMGEGSFGGTVWKPTVTTMQGAAFASTGLDNIAAYGFIGGSMGEGSFGGTLWVTTL